MIAETKHTAGPWIVTDGQSRGARHIFVDAVDGTYVASCHGKNAEAYAHLIAAAPDLLAALKAAKDFIGNGYQPPELVDQMFAAISKAEGAS